MENRGSQQDDDVVDDSQPGKTTMVDVIITGCNIYTELSRISSFMNFVLVIFCMNMFAVAHEHEPIFFATHICNFLPCCLVN